MRFSLVFLLGVLGSVIFLAGCESAPAEADDARLMSPSKRGDRNHRHVPRHHHCHQHDHH